MIDVNEGDDLEVFVKNELPVESTIHWHGLLQRGTPQMDGVPGVTQVSLNLSFDRPKLLVRARSLADHIAVSDPTWRKLHLQVFRG